MELPKRIVLIDDDPVCQLISTRIIAHCSTFNVETFIESRVALRELTKRAEQEPNEFPDFIFLDINMPLMNGWQFLEEFQKLPVYVLEKCSVIILSSSVLPSDIDMSRRYTVVKKFLSKPLSIETLKQATHTGNTINS